MTEDLQQHAESGQAPLRAGGNAGTAVAGSAPVPSFDAMVARYEQAMAVLGRDTHDLFPVLLARDAVEALRREHSPLTPEQPQRLVALDDHLRQHAVVHLPDELPVWRQSLQPPTQAQS